MFNNWDDGGYLVGFDTLHFYYICQLFYPLNPASRACYAFSDNLLFLNYALKFLVYTGKNISFFIVLKHDRNRNIIFYM